MPTDGADEHVGAQDHDTSTPGSLSRKQIAFWSIVIGGIAAVGMVATATRDIGSAHAPPPASVDEHHLPAPASPEPPAVVPPVDAEKLRVDTRNQYLLADARTREDAVRACALSSACHAAQLGGIVASAGSERDQEFMRRLGHAWAAYAAAQSAVDGPEWSLDALRGVVGHLNQCSIRDVRRLDRTTFGEADKDIVAARGKSIRVAGTVVQIRRDGAVYSGLLSVDDGIAMFVAVGETAGVVAGSWAEFVGIVLQRRPYERNLGGTIEAIAVVGRFVGQKDADPPLPAPETGAASGGRQRAETRSPPPAASAE